MIVEDALVQGWKKEIPLDDIDKELRDLVLVLNMLPGIRTTSCCVGHPVDGEIEPNGDPSMRWKPASIFFNVHPEADDVGLFILSRCSDRRYWRFGSCWSIELSVGDLMIKDEISGPTDGLRPTQFCLNSSAIWGRHPIVLTQEWATVSARNLVENIWWHLFEAPPKNFLDYYLLPPRSFWERIWPAQDTLLRSGPRAGSGHGLGTTRSPVSRSSSS